MSFFSVFVCLLCSWIILSSGRPVASPKIAVNCGSSLSVTSDGVLFQSDSFFNGGEIYEREQNKMNESQRSGEEFSYEFTGLKPLLKYVVVLHFSELEGKKANERIFDVYSQNELFLESVDIASQNVTTFSHAGVMQADNSGSIHLRFVGLIGNAQVCGIELYFREDVLNGHVTEEGLGNSKRVINTLPKNVLWGYLPAHWYYEHEPYAWRRWGDSSSMGYPTVGGVGYLKGEDYYGSGVTWFWADSNALTVPPGDYIGKCRWRFEANAQFSENFAWHFDNAGAVDFWAPPYFGQGWIVFQHPSIFRATSTLNTTGFGLYRTPPTSFKRGISIDACWLEKCSNSSCLSIDECSTHASPCNVPDVCTDTETGYTCTPLTPSTPVRVTSNPFVATGHVADSHIMLPGVCGNDYPKGNIVLINGTGAYITLSLAVSSGPAPYVHLNINGVLTCQLTFPYTFFSEEGLDYKVYITGATSEYSLTVTHTIIQPKNITTLNYEFVSFVPESTTGSVLLSWDAPPTGNLATSPILEYSVLRNNAPYFTTTSTSIVIPGLTKNTVYRFTLYVKTVHFPLSLNTLTPSIRSPTTAPRAPVLVVSGTSATSTVLTWSVADRGGANPAPTTYVLETSEDGITYPPSGFINTGATAFRTLNWDRATKALYARVRLTVSSGTSDYSNVIFLAPLTPATPPTDLTATLLIEDPNLYTSSVTVTFTPPSDLGGGTLQYYSVLLDDGLGWSYETVVYGSGETAAFEQSGNLGVGDAISVTVAAVTDIVYGDYSDPAIAYAA